VVVATEGRAGPLARLRRRLEPLGIDCRPGDGLSAVQAGEVEVAVIAGVGGHRIAHILAASPAVTERVHLLVLQPMQHLEYLRSWLAASGFKVGSEAPVVESGRRYTVLVVGPRKRGTG